MAANSSRTQYMVRMRPLPSAHRQTLAYRDPVLTDLDPVLGASATLGFAMPFIKVGWGITVSLSITKSSLLRWARGVSLPQAPNGCPRVGKRFHTPDSACSSAFAASDAVLIAEDL